MRLNICLNICFNNLCNWSDRTGKQKLSHSVSAAVSYKSYLSIK